MVGGTDLLVEADCRSIHLSDHGRLCVVAVVRTVTLLYPSTSNLASGLVLLDIYLSVEVLVGTSIAFVNETYPTWVTAVVDLRLVHLSVLVVSEEVWLVGRGGKEGQACDGAIE